MDTPATSAPGRHDVYSVSRLNQEVRALLEAGLPMLWVEAEISNLARPRSGHLYFTLKDSGAQVRCAMFRNRNTLLRFRPGEGDQVLVRARVSLYAPRGDYQLIVEHMEAAGDGALRRAFEELQARLRAEGLFEPERKKPLPALCRRLGVITSPTGAAIRDVLHVMRRRFAGTRIIIYPVPVQGEAAPSAIVDALATAARRNEVDALLLTRGGGSLEDLQPFNDEHVARAVAACPLPIVSAVGHETDLVITDLVADQRAPTPSAGAELLSIDGLERRHRIEGMRERLAARIRHRLRAAFESHDQLTRRLAAQHPSRRLQERAQKLDELEARLTRATRRGMEERGRHLRSADERLTAANPRRRLEQLRPRVSDARGRLTRGLQRRLQQERTRLEAAARQMHAVSPLATLGRGYALVTDADGVQPLQSWRAVVAGDTVLARLAEGELVCRVTGTHDAESCRVLPSATAEKGDD